jgi:hypothetical protein
MQKPSTITIEGFAVGGVFGSLSEKQIEQRCDNQRKDQ